MARFRCCQNPVHLNLKKTKHTPCNSLDTCKIRHLYRKCARFRCFIGAIGTNGKCAAESTPDGVWQKWLRKSPMHLNAGAGRHERGNTLNKRMLQRPKQEWPRFRCCQNPVHLNLKKQKTYHAIHWTHARYGIFTENTHGSDASTAPKANVPQKALLTGYGRNDYAKAQCI